MKFVDISLPIKTDRGAVGGVLAAHRPGPGLRGESLVLNPTPAAAPCESLYCSCPRAPFLLGGGWVASRSPPLLGRQGTAAGQQSSLLEWTGPQAGEILTGIARLTVMVDLSRAR